MIVHFPSLPPAAPAFRAIIASVARVTAEQGARAAARLCREKAEVIAYQMSDPTPERVENMLRDRVSAFDLDELVDWLCRRADELDPENRRS